jgi:hypothetical protein
MVYMSGSKSSRNIASIVNRGNTCGGVKKAGLSYTGVGQTKGAGNGNVYSRGINTVFGVVCGQYATKNPTQIRRGSYAASHNPAM